MIDLSNATIDAITTLKDGSIKITLLSQELSTKEMTELFQSYSKFRNQEEDALREVRFDETKTAGRKSKAQRLHGVLFVYWQQRPKVQEKYATFDVFYDDILEKYIDAWKSKLESNEHEEDTTG